MADAAGDCRRYPAVRLQARLPGTDRFLQTTAGETDGQGQTRRQRPEAQARPAAKGGPAMTYPHNTARRVIPLREIVRRSAKPRAKKPTPSFPAADQLAHHAGLGPTGAD